MPKPTINIEMDEAELAAFDAACKMDARTRASGGRIAMREWAGRIAEEHRIKAWDVPKEVPHA